MSKSIDYIKAKIKFDDLLKERIPSGPDQQLNTIYKATGYASTLFGFDVSMNHNDEHPYAPYPSLVISEVDRVNQDWCHAIHFDSKGELTISKLNPDISQKEFVEVVIEGHLEDEAIHNGY